MGRAPHQDLWMSERPEDAAAVARALERCDLTPLADRRVETLSGGELRRVAIARALAQGPRVLLLDEPAAFLDVRHRLELGALLASVSREDRIACLVAMHELSAAASLASQALLLKAGRVVACGRPAEVLTREHLAVAFDADVRPGRDGPTGEPYFVVARGGV
jgi:iron complex transport system ATP-binding protein